MARICEDRPLRMAMTMAAHDDAVAADARDIGAMNAHAACLMQRMARRTCTPVAAMVMVASPEGRIAVTYDDAEPEVAGGSGGCRGGGGADRAGNDESGYCSGLGKGLQHDTVPRDFVRFELSARSPLRGLSAGNM